MGDEDAAAAWLGQRPVISPLGNVVKFRPDLSRKNRLIQDLRASGVNAASTVHERQVLPRFADHGHDIAALAALGSSVGVFILDFKHAFMTIPLAREEMPYNTSVVPESLTRTRPPLDDAEPSTGTVLVWRVLGFGGHANPLVYARIASFACRSGQGLLQHETAHSKIAHGRMQLYVDDPAVVLSGDLFQQKEAIDVLVLWWLVLGIPLSWAKGSFQPADVPHTWIGVRFMLRQNFTIMSLPEEFLASLLSLAQKFADSKVRTAKMKEAQELCGRVGRVGQVVPEVKPFVSNLYGALAGSIRAAETRSREAAPGSVATRRYRTSAQWLVHLLRQDGSAPLELRSIVLPSAPSFDPQRFRVEFDASPWGGAALLFEQGDLKEWFAIEWEDIEWLQIKIGESRHQTFWEFLVLTLAAVQWCPIYDELLFCGDNVASLQLALSHKGQGAIAIIGRELAWRKAKHLWQYAVAHLPAEANKLADRLSRLADPSFPPLASPPIELEGAARVHVHLDRLWSFKS